MPVITSKLLGTSIIAPQKQAEKEGKNPKEKHRHQFVMLTISNYGENAECTRFFFVNCILIMLEAGKLQQEKQEIKGRKEGDDRKGRYIKSI